MTEKSTLKTFLWFNNGLDEALDFYKKTFGDVTVRSENRMTPDGPLFTAEFSIFDHEIIGMNVEGGPQFNSAISLMISCDGQSESDRLWDAITAEGKDGQCGWCTDKWGVSWQVVPTQMQKYVGDPDPKKAEFAWKALRGMTRIVLDGLHE